MGSVSWVEVWKMNIPTDILCDLEYPYIFLNVNHITLPWTLNKTACDGTQFYSYFVADCLDYIQSFNYLENGVSRKRLPNKSVGFLNGHCNFSTFQEKSEILNYRSLI